MDFKFTSAPVKRGRPGVLLVIFFTTLFASLTWAESPKDILYEYYRHDLETNGPIIIDFKLSSNKYTEALAKVYYYDIHNRMITFSKPENMKSTLYLCKGFNSWIYTGTMQSPLRISSQQRLFGDASIAEVSRIDFCNDYKIDKMTEDDKTYQFEVTALNKQEAYQKATVFFRKHNNSNLNITRTRVVIYSVSGLPLKEISYGELKNINGLMVSTFEVKNLLQKTDNVTTCDILNITPKPDMNLNDFNPLKMSKFRLLINK